MKTPDPGGFFDEKKKKPPLSDGNISAAETMRKKTTAV